MLLNLEKIGQALDRSLEAAVDTGNSGQIRESPPVHVTFRMGSSCGAR